MPDIFAGGTKYGDPRELVEDYLSRLRAAEPVNNLEKSPIKGADDRNVAEMADIFNRLKKSAEEEGPKAQLTTKPLREELDLLFRNRQDYIQSLDPSELKYFGDRIQDWSRESGLSIKDLNNQDFGGMQHETVSHHLPWQKGFSLDTQPKVIEGFELSANPASPLNELLATEIDRALNFNKPIDLRKAIYSRDGAQRLGNFYRSLGQYAAAMSETGNPQFTNKELEGPRGPELMDRFNRFVEASTASSPFAFRQNSGDPLGFGFEVPPHLADVGLQLDEASKLLNWKFVEPLRRRFENLGEAQAPSEISRDLTPSWSNEYSLLSGLGGAKFREARNLPVDETNYTRLLNLGQNLKSYLTSIPGRTSRYGGSSNLLFGVDPAAAAASAIPEVLSNVKRVPASLLPGAADLIPSPEAIRTGYAQGPVEMGKQMAQEFAQSLPTAAGSAMLLSTPVLAPLAPGIGAGMVGVAGTKALNEVVRQETGEGIVPKVRQFLGTAPRTGVSAPARQGEKPLVAQVKPLTEAQRTQMNKNQTRSEMQRRMDLAKERFNPRKGEFGLSELLFGR
jgi:hypothetical protein